MRKSVIHKFFHNNQSEEVKQLFGKWLRNDANMQEKEDAMKDLWLGLNAEMDASTLDDLELLHKKMGDVPVKRVRMYTHLRRIAAIILIPLLSSFLAYYFTQSFYSENSDFIECYVEYGKTKEITMPDGTHVHLNSGSLLVYPTRFNGKTRNVYLSGEANFEVAKDPNKRLIVRTDHLKVEALGTTFNLQAYQDLDRVTTTLEGGKIRVETFSEKPQVMTLLPNEQVIYDKKNQIMTLKTVDAKRLALWREEYLVFQEASFSEILHALEKRYGVIFHYDSQKYEERHFTIRFSPNDKLEDTLEILQEVNRDFNYRIKGKSVYLL